MSDLRKEFEELQKVSEIISGHSDELAFNEDVNRYETPVYENWTPEFLYEINFGWYAFQEKQKQIDAINQHVVSFYAEADLWGFDSDQAIRQIDLIQELLK